MTRHMPQVGDRVELVKYDGFTSACYVSQMTLGMLGNITELSETGVYSTLVTWDNGVVEWHDSGELEYKGDK